MIPAGGSNGAQIPLKQIPDQHTRSTSHISVVPTVTTTPSVMLLVPPAGEVNCGVGLELDGDVDARLKEGCVAELEDGRAEKLAKDSVVELAGDWGVKLELAEDRDVKPADDDWEREPALEVELVGEFVEAKV